MNDRWVVSYLFTIWISFLKQLEPCLWMDGSPFKSGCKLWWTSRVALNPQFLKANVKQLLCLAGKQLVSHRLTQNWFVETSLTFTLPSRTQTSRSIKTNVVLKGTALRFPNIASVCKYLRSIMGLYIQWRI